MCVYNDAGSVLLAGVETMKYAAVLIAAALTASACSTINWREAGQAAYDRDCERRDRLDPCPDDGLMNRSDLPTG